MNHRSWLSWTRPLGRAGAWARSHWAGGWLPRVSSRCPCPSLRVGSRARDSLTEPHHPRWMKPRLWWIGVLFMVVSALFALGSAPFYPEFVPCDTGELLNTEATNAFTVLGAVWFFAGAWLMSRHAAEPAAAVAGQ